MFEAYRDEITAAFEEYIALIPRRKSEYIRARDSVSGDLAILFMKAVTQLVITDAVSADTEQLLLHVGTVLRARETVEYCRDIPDDIFLDFVLPYRVNDEDFAPCSDVFYGELYPMVRDKTLRTAALEVNYWCLSKASYRASDDRTKNALATVNVGHGRCGEESVLCVSALRSVGIPARQVYSPHWLHCDDNHAWVEVFTGKKWEFMGACEPESQLNTGWFNHAASKAGVVRYRVFGKVSEGTTSDGNRIFSTFESTDKYAETKTVTVKVDGFPRTKVGVYTVNYGQMCLLREKITDINGIAEFETGLADLIYFVYTDEGFDARAVGADETYAELAPNEGLRYLDFALDVPEGVIGDSGESSEAHRRTVSLLEERRRTAHRSKWDENEYFNKAGFNAPEIEKFLHYGRLTKEQIELTLTTLSDKDFSDIKFKTLLDIALAFEHRGELPEDIFRDYVLNMRVKNEALAPHRQLAMAFWPEEMRPKTPQDVCAWILGMTRKMDSLAYPNVTGSLAAVLETGVTVSDSLGVHMVQLMRALGIPARLSEQDGAVEYYDGFGFVPVFEGDRRSARLIIKDKTGVARYGEDYTVCEIDETGRFNRLKLGGTVHNVRAGLYAVTQVKRQIDGSQNGTVTFVRLCANEDAAVVLTEIRDRTRERLRAVETSLSDGIAAYIEPGTEPTEHFLNELIELDERIPVQLFAGQNKPDKTLKRVLDLGLARIKYEDFDENWVKLRRKMGVGDERLPFSLAVKDGRARFAFANYNVGTVKLLADIGRGG